MESIEQLKEIIAKDAGHPDFPKLGRMLFEAGREDEAIGILLGGLSNNPEAHEGRLLLAQIFFERGYLPFAIREVEYLQSALPQLESLTRLLQSLNPEKKIDNKVSQASTQETIAETDFDFDEIDLLSSNEPKKS